ncbi:MAG: DEAD/DEAH box helicase [Kofleriaceae bacterium]|nr:DEAD/DEAH box helicase [Kofleriaceae bacterium]
MLHAVAIPPTAAPSAPPSEAFVVLYALAQRACDDDELARALAVRALKVTVGTDFAVARDALAALLRRLESSEDVRVVRSGAGYRSKKAGRDGRPYEMVLGVDGDGALEGSCSCRDFGKSALGWCKHLFAAARAAKATKLRAMPCALRWNPVRPFTGPGERLARLWLDPRVERRLPRRVAELFQTTPAGRPIDPRALEGVRRVETLERLLAACRQDPQLAEPAIVPMLEEELADTQRGSSIGEKDLSRMLRGFKRTLYPYQRTGVQTFLRAGRLLLADDMGLGKTAQAIASCHALFASGRVKRALIVVPASLKAQWLREWKGFTDVAITLVEGPADARAEVYKHRREGVLLVNYEQLLRDLPSVQAFAPELVVLDEAQRIKNWETRTAAVVKQLAPAWRLVLTGTPMENRLEELSSIMEWVDEHALEPRWRLPSWHAVRADGGREVVGARNLETLRARLAPSMLRRVRTEVLAQLPARTDTALPLTLTLEQQAAHDDLSPAIARLAGMGNQRPLTHPEFLRLMTLLAKQRMICNALVLPQFAEVWPELANSRRKREGHVGELGSPKLLDLRERLVELVVTQQRKVVVFSQWRRMLQLAEWACADVLARAGVKAVFFTGEESQRRRAENIVAFHDDPAVRVLFASDAGGVGLNLQRAASCCINLEVPWNPAVLEQRIGRIYRLGQLHPIEVYNYVATGGLEERIAQLVGDKRALFTGLFDGASDEVTFDSSSSFLARVQQLVEPSAASIHGDHGNEADDDADQDVLFESGRDEDEADERPARAQGFEAASAGHATPPDSAFLGEARADAGAAGASSLLQKTTAGVASADITELVRAFAGLEARPLADGRVALEMPAPAASVLGSLLRSLASALDGVAPRAP